MFVMITELLANTLVSVSLRSALIAFTLGYACQTSFLIVSVANMPFFGDSATNNATIVPHLLQKPHEMEFIVVEIVAVTLFKVGFCVLQSEKFISLPH